MSLWLLAHKVIYTTAPNDRVNCYLIGVSNQTIETVLCLLFHGQAHVEAVQLLTECKPEFCFPFQSNGAGFSLFSLLIALVTYQEF